MRPWSSVGTRVTRSRPMPSIWSAAKIVTCDSSLTTTGISGAPNSPSRSTSQPARARRAFRAAEIPVNDAIVAPVVNPTLTPAGQPEQVRQPGARHLLGHRGRRPDDVQARVLVPGRGQPVGRQRRRHAPADDEPEVPRPGARDETALRVRRQRLDDRHRVGALVRQRPAEPPAQLVDRDRRAPPSDPAGRRRTRGRSPRRARARHRSGWWSGRASWRVRASGL